MFQPYTGTSVRLFKLHSSNTGKTENFQNKVQIKTDYSDNWPHIANSSPFGQFMTVSFPTLTQTFENVYSLVVMVSGVVKYAKH